jgi:hypothetical protein
MGRIEAAAESVTKPQRFLAVNGAPAKDRRRLDRKRGLVFAKQMCSPLVAEQPSSRCGIIPLAGRPFRTTREMHLHDAGCVVGKRRRRTPNAFHCGVDQRRQPSPADPALPRTVVLTEEAAG